MASSVSSLAVGKSCTDYPVTWGAVETARQIRDRKISAREVLEARLKRIEQVEPSIRAIAIPLFESAQQAALACDERQASGSELPPLHGVPVSIKECFYVRGTDSCIGLSALVGDKSPVDGSSEGPLVKLLREAGSVIVGKTNVPQLMMWNECDNPVYGRTNNPWDVTRTPGGSSGGEAALIAAGGSALGLVNDLGGSIRVPAHFCGLAGLKPTSYRLSRDGTRRNFRGVVGMVTSAGPIARRVEDLELAMQVWLGGNAGGQDRAFPVSYSPPTDDGVKGMRIVAWKEDGIFPAARAVQRGVEEAAKLLQQAGAHVDLIDAPPFLGEVMEIFLGLLASDGGADLSALAKGSRLDWRCARLLWLGRLGAIRRELIATGLALFGQKWQGKVLRQTASSSGKQLWQWQERQEALKAKFLHWLQEHNYQAILSPPYATAALPHATAIDLVPASSYALWANLFSIPAGVVPITSVALTDLPISAAATLDVVLKQLQAVQQNSVGLPIGVQVAALPWREDVCLKVMRALERE